MASFLSNAGKTVTDVRTFLRENASNNSIKYAAEKGAKHLIYIPFTNSEKEGENGETLKVKQLVAIAGNVHEYHTADGKYKAVVCLNGVHREENGVVINDGSCPYCDRISDAWDIYNYRKNQEETLCKLVGEERKKHLEAINRTFADDRKAKVARAYMYMLVVKFKFADNKVVISDTDKLPEFELKVMKLASSRLEKMTDQLNNSGIEIEGAELLFQYPSVDDPRLLVSQSTTSPVFKKTVDNYPGLIEKINEAVEKFDWEGIPKSFPEWSGQSTTQAKQNTDVLFEKWDEYKKDLLTNPGAKYMEYVSNAQVSNPSLGPVMGAAIPSELGDASKLVVPGSIDVNAVLGGSTEIKL